MKFSLHIPLNVELENEIQNAAAVRTIAQAAEQAGFDACNLTDHPAPSAKWRNGGGHDAFDPFTVLAFIAAATTRLRLHTHILVLPYRNPFLTAKSAASVDVLSDGRLILGIGSGYMRGEYAALGVDFETRGAAMDEALQVMKLAWSGEPVVYEGRTFKAVGNLPRPLPVQKPHPPIWGGGNSERAIRRAAELCDGWCPFFAPPELAKSARTDELVTLADLKAKIDVLHHHLERVGRSGPYDILGSAPEGLKACDASHAQAFADSAGELAKLGVTWIGVNLPHASLAGFLDAIQWAGEELLPKARG